MPWCTQAQEKPRVGTHLKRTQGGGIWIFRKLWFSISPKLVLTLRYLWVLSSVKKFAEVKISQGRFSTHAVYQSDISELLPLNV